MLTESFIFCASMFVVIKGATLATKHATNLAESYRLSKYVVGFLVVAVISILPETIISLNAALDGVPEFGLGMLFGSNIADLTLIFAIIIFATGRGLKVESHILKNRFVFPAVLMLPLLLGTDGYYSRIDGLVLIIVGGVFYYLALRGGIDETLPVPNGEGRWWHVVKLLGSMFLLLVGAHFTVESAVAISSGLGISPILVGMLVVGLGTTMPELFFGLKAANRRESPLVFGDLLGTVLADATVVIGLLALVSPFNFPIRIVYVTGVFMVLASVLLFYFMKTGRFLSRREAYILLGFWATFVVVELMYNL